MKRIDKYKSGEMEAHELEQITEQLLADKEQRERRQRWEQRLQQDKSRQPTAIRRSLRTWLSVAAVLLVGVLAIVAIQRSSNDYDTLMASHLAETYANNETRKSGNSVDSLKSLAISAYLSHDFKASAEYREAYLQEVAPDKQDLLFLGLSYLYQQPANADKAISTFNNLLALDGSLFGEETEWHLSLAYLLAGDYAKAKQLLNKIIAGQQWNAELAAELLPEIPE